MKRTAILAAFILLITNAYSQETYIWQGQEYYVLPDTFSSVNVGSFENGISYVSTFSLPDGRWIQLSSTPGQLPFCTGEIKNGEPAGRWDIYYFISDDDHHLSQQIPFDHGKINGSYFTFYESGKVKTHYEMKDNYSHGPVIGYTLEGGVEMEGSFQYDIPTGVWKHYKDGKLNLVQTYKNEIPSDSIEAYRTKYYYFSHRPDTIHIPSAEGTWISYYETGNVKWEKTYEGGLVVYVKEYHPNGQLKFEGSAAGELSQIEIDDNPSRKANDNSYKTKLKKVLPGHEGSELYIKKDRWRFYDKDGKLLSVEYYDIPVR